MSRFTRLKLLSVLSMMAVAGLGCAGSVEQNLSWTVERAPELPTYKVVAYGDSIFSGFYSVDHPYRVALRAAPYVAGEYWAQKWNANVKVVRRTRAGALAGEVYNEKIVAESSYMRSDDTRVVMFEMCGSNYLNVKGDLRDPNDSRFCSYDKLEEALSRCTTHMEAAMQYINANASSAVEEKIIMNLYYPGYGADDSLTTCKDATTGQPINRQEKFLPYLARSNWRACNLAEQYGFRCADAFAQMMAADDDSNEDGVMDPEALRYVSGESEEDYVNRITVTLRSTLRDPQAHFVGPDTSYAYLLPDGTHPTYYGGSVERGGDGSSAPKFSDDNVVDWKSPEWNKWGHERIGLEIFNTHPLGGVVFVHGTGDYSPEGATSKYWTQASVDAMRNGRPYLVVGYPGVSCAGFEQCSWGAIVDQISSWVSANDIPHFTVITHSNGANPVRYMLGHPGAVSASGHTVQSVTSRISQVIFLAPTLAGTPLADQITSSDSTLYSLVGLVELFWDEIDREAMGSKPSLVQQRLDSMRFYNSVGTFAGSQGATTVGGKPISVVRGNFVHAKLFSSDAHCGGPVSIAGITFPTSYPFTLALKVAATIGWGSPDAATDGFIGVESSGYFGNIIIDDSRLNHHQSRRGCHSSGNIIARKVANAPIPAPTDQNYEPEPNVEPELLACDTYSPGYDTDLMTGHTVERYGCSESQRNNGQIEPDCLLSYGTASGYTIPSTESWNPFLDPSNYPTWSEVCPDSWHGNGVCDACLVAKYGYDAAPGPGGSDDCVRAPPGQSNQCGVLSWDTKLGAPNYSIVEEIH